MHVPDFKTCSREERGAYYDTGNPDRWKLIIDWENPDYLDDPDGSIECLESPLVPPLKVYDLYAFAFSDFELWEVVSVMWESYNAHLTAFQSVSPCNAPVSRYNAFEAGQDSQDGKGKGGPETSASVPPPIDFLLIATGCDPCAACSPKTRFTSPTRLRSVSIPGERYSFRSLCVV